MDIESSSKKENDKQTMDPNGAKTRKRRRGKIACLACIAIIVALALLITILALTVFKAKRPVTTVNSIALSNLDISISIAPPSVHLNVTIDAGVTVTNPNRVGFKYSNSTAFLRYRGQEVGEAPIPAGKIGARGTQTMNVSLVLMADRLLSNSSVYTDVISGTLPLQTYMRISGKVRVLFSIHVVTYTTCDLDVSIGSRGLANQKCQYKTKL